MTESQRQSLEILLNSFNLICKTPIQSALEQCSENEAKQILDWIDIIETWENLRMNSGGLLAENDSVLVIALRKNYPNYRISRNILYRKRILIEQERYMQLLDGRGRTNKGKCKIPLEIAELFKKHYLQSPECKGCVVKCIQAVKSDLEKRNKLINDFPCYSTFLRLARRIKKER